MWNRGARRGQGMELVPSRRGPAKSSMLAGLAASVKGKAASMQEDAKGKVSRFSSLLLTAVVIRTVPGRTSTFSKIYPRTNTVPGTSMCVWICVCSGVRSSESL